MGYVMIDKGLKNGMVRFPPIHLTSVPRALPSAAIYLAGPISSHPNKIISVYVKLQFRRCDTTEHGDGTIRPKIKQCH